MQKTTKIVFDPIRIDQLSEEELLRAILLRDEYQPEARVKIIEVALSRNIILSEADLNKPEFSSINLSKQRFFQFSVITSEQDAKDICQNVFKYFYVITLGFGGMAGLNRIVYDSNQMWVSLMFMIIYLLLTIGFHWKKSVTIARLILLVAFISSINYLIALFSSSMFVGITGILLNFILLYFGSEAYFATRFLHQSEKNNSKTGSLEPTTLSNHEA